MERMTNRPALISWIAAVRFLGMIKAGTKAMSSTEDELDKRLQTLFNKVNVEIVRQIKNKSGLIPAIMQAAVAPMAGIIFEQIRKAETDINPRVETQLRDYAFEASKRTVDRMTGDVMATLSQAYSKGLGTIEAAKLIEADFSKMTDWELKRVSRTEVNAAQNLNNFSRMETAGVRFIQWITAEDERVRDTVQANHRILQGQIVRLGNRFSNGLLHPGDRSTGDLAEFINCRCVAVPFILPLGFMAPWDGNTPFYENDLVRIAA